MALVRMLVHLTGTREGAGWPAIGETIALPDDEAARLIRGHAATYVRPPDEAATIASPVERAVRPVTTRRLRGE